MTAAPAETTVSADVWTAEHDEPIPYAVTDEGKLSRYADALDVLPPAVLRWWASREGADL